MSTTKKILSTLLAILMIVMSVPVAFAAQESDGTPTTITLEASQTLVYVGTSSGDYDPDGYIITGYAPNTIIYVYAPVEITLKNMTASRVDFWCEGKTVTLKLEGDNNLSSGNITSLNVYKTYVVINGGADDTLTATSGGSFATTVGNSGSLTVNGGKIRATVETDGTNATIACDGGYTQNGGEVTVSNNNFYTIDCKTYLNGGTLNVINTSSNSEALNGNVTVKSGAVLTVSGNAGLMYGNSTFSAADGNYIFAKYDEASDFVPIYDTSVLNKKTYAQIKADAHTHSYSSETGYCVCGKECNHLFTDNVCNNCSFVCHHKSLTDGVCSVCAKTIITKQPTSADPTLKIYDADAAYQWYDAKAVDVEITDENAIPFESSYDSETGWTPYTNEKTSTQYYFIVELKADETLLLEFSSAPGMISIGEQVCTNVGTEYEYIAPADGTYPVVALYNGTTITAKAYIRNYEYTEIEGEAGATLKNPVIGNYYACKATDSNEDVFTSKVLKYTYAIIHQPTTDEPYVTLNDDMGAESYLWYKVDPKRTEITSVNASGDWSVFGAPSEIKCSYDENTGWSGYSLGGMAFYFLIELEEGDIINLVLSSESKIAAMGYSQTPGTFETDDNINYTFTAVSDGIVGFIVEFSSETAPTLNAYTNGYEYTAIKRATKAKITTAEDGTYACEVTFKDGRTEMSETAEIKAVEDSEADYTEIDAAIAEIEKKIADNNIADEYTADFEAIKDKLEELKADKTATADDVAELMEKLDTYEEELDAGIADGTWVEDENTPVTPDTPNDSTECEDCDGSLSICEKLAALSGNGMFGRFFSWLHILLHIFAAIFG